MQGIAPAVADGRRENVKPSGFFAVDVIEDGTTTEVTLNALPNILTHSLEEWVARGHPFKGGVLRQELLVECDLFVLAAELPKARLQALAHRPERSRNLPNAVDVLVLLSFLGINTRMRRRLQEKVFDHLGHQPALFGFRRFAENRREVQLTLGEALQR
jgi:hypothetical protein